MYNGDIALPRLPCREPSNIGNHLRNLLKERDTSLELGLEPISLSMGPWPAEDKCGYQVAIEILRASQRPGRNAKDYSQFELIRKLRSSYLTAYEASPARCLDNLTLKADRGHSYSVLNSKTQSKLFGMFSEKRIERLFKQDVGILFEMLTEMLNDYKKELRDTDVDKVRRRFVVMHAGRRRSIYVRSFRACQEER